MSEASVELGRTGDADLAEEYRLVLLARGIDANIAHLDGAYVLLVATGRYEEASRELAQYSNERRAQRPAAEPAMHLPWRNASLFAVGIYAFVLVFVTNLAVRGSFGGNWYAAGRLEVDRVVAGQWWRCLTALTLHVDFEHLIANIGFGGVFGFIAGRFFGPGAAWLLILLAGAAGNCADAWLAPAGHRAVGASTAIFAALGLTSVFSWRERSTSRRIWAYRVAPVVAGVVLLAYTGTGDESTDVLAHLTGFLAGATAGSLPLNSLRRACAGGAAQLACGIAAISVLIVAWIVAITRAG
ncbi:MAG: rhomboid family intramembrane serine protease [Steroidobacteraceae bacterium]